MWLDAAVQIFYSLGVAYGSLIAFSSYNPIKNDSTRDAITVCLINCATSIYASVVVFAFIGFQVYYNFAFLPLGLTIKLDDSRHYSRHRSVYCRSIAFVEVV